MPCPHGFHFHGSEARAATLIRNLAKTDPKHILNHPSIEEMRAAKCKSIYLVDDFIGSGERVSVLISFAKGQDVRVVVLSEIHHIVVLAYSGTEKGLRSSGAQNASRMSLLNGLARLFPQCRGKKLTAAAVFDLCRKYGRMTSMGYYWDGYGGAMALLYSSMAVRITARRSCGRLTTPKSLGSHYSRIERSYRPRSRYFLLR